MSDAISMTIEEQVVEVTVLTPTFVQINLLQPTILPSQVEIDANTDHREGDGSDHDDVAKNSSFVDPATSSDSLTPANGATAAVDVATTYDYTITPLGGAFTLDIDNIPAAPEPWSVTIYAINWDGVSVSMPAGSATPDAAGLSFTPGGGKDRLVARGKEGPAGEKEFYNLPGNMG